MLPLAAAVLESNARRAAARLARGFSTTAQPGTGCALHVGTKYTYTRSFSPADVEAFTALTGDSNPLHGKQGPAGSLSAAIMPGMLTASMFAALIGSTFPGALYLSQTLRFKATATVGELLTATLVVERASGRRVSFLTECRAAPDSGSVAGKLVVEGTALALIPRAARKE